MTVGQLVRLVLAVAIAGACFVAGYRLSRFRPAAPMPRPEAGAGPTRPSPTPLAEIEWSTIKHTRGAAPAWQAKIASIEISAGGQAIQSGPLQEAVVFDRSGRAVVRVTAAAIKGSTRSRDFEVKGPVRAVAEQGAIIEAASVKWNDAAATLHCFGPVTVRTKDAVVTAPQADLKVEQNIVVASGEVRLTAGNNIVVGRKLVYHLDDGSFTLQQVRGILHVEEARQRLKRARGGR